jgi:4a-hydroxytetrahydrobiopterin dehydratase
MKALSPTEIKEFLSNHLSKWSFDGKSIKREIKFKNFVEAFAFMTAVALEAEKISHHPEWTNIYNQLSITLNTHDANGITTLDFDLAKTIESLVKKVIDET